ncbi:helix-turn-helix domain-containing protein [Streptomyces sclerotialus]|uniref:helix-turn-helix domain-containing protein n=1 Tax=Streptomyces sclerotialus TaxID=1957 RepID=UPI000691B3E4
MIVRLAEAPRDPGTDSLPNLPDPYRWSTAVDRVDSLSARERTILVLLGNGDSNRSISRRLDISERTVKSHMSQILAKLGVESRLQAGLVACAWAQTCPAARHPERRPAGVRAA